MIKRLCTVLAIGAAIALMAFPPSARALSCRTYHNHNICLEQVQRSAKYRWRYRVKATVDGQRQPLTRYNCRDRTRTVLEGNRKGDRDTFASGGVGEMVCGLVHR